MPIAPLPANDLVSRTLARSAHSRGQQPVPLVATSYAIAITAGLADVTVRRTFRNQEAVSIEATLTLPIPVHAVLYALEARIAGRVVKAVARAKAVARSTYEDAIDHGKTSVLHEEVVRGVHMLSVGHVAPGTEIEVTARFALALASIGGRALLRIPMTVGDVYGCSGLPDADELVHGGPVSAADLTVTVDSGVAILLGGKLEDGKATIPLDRPIDIEVREWFARRLTGRAANGHRVALTIAPGPVSEATLDAAILVDRSGSMLERCSFNSGLTKHAAVLLGLSEAADEISAGDRINVWQFNSRVDDLGTTQGQLRTLLRKLDPPEAGTEIGRAIDEVIARRPNCDVLLVTDGKSYALDVQRLATSGARFSVVLIGEDSLEANVGHLAALTGGQIFVPEGADVSAAVRGALQSMRSPRAVVAPPLPEESSTVHAVRAGMAVSADWQPAGFEPDDAIDPPAGRAAAAYAASLWLTRLAADDAARLAEAEGLVTHLTSLVLVDEAGAPVTGLPATRKIALPTPVTLTSPRAAHASAIHPSEAMSDRASYSHARSPRIYCLAKSRRSYSDAPLARNLSAGLLGSVSHVEPGSAAARSAGRVRAPAQTSDPAEPPARPAKPSSLDPRLRELAKFAGRIDWRGLGSRLANGNLEGLAPEVAEAIEKAARARLLARAARRIGISARVFVIGLLARADAGRDRYADRVARSLLGKASEVELTKLAGRLGIVAAVG